MEFQKFDYFMVRTEKDLVDINHKLDRLWDFRLLLIGASVTVSTVCSVVISLAAIYYGLK